MGPVQFVCSPVSKSLNQESILGSMHIHAYKDPCMYRCNDNNLWSLVRQGSDLQPFMMCVRRVDASTSIAVNPAALYHEDCGDPLATPALHSLNGDLQFTQRHVSSATNTAGCLTRLKLLYSDARTRNKSRTSQCMAIQAWLVPATRCCRLICS